MAAGSLSFGGNMSVALGPLGRNGEASGALNTHGKLAAMYVAPRYSSFTHLTPPTGTAIPRLVASSEASP